MEAPPAPRIDRPPVGDRSRRAAPLSHWVNQICTHPGVHEHLETSDGTE